MISSRAFSGTTSCGRVEPSPIVAAGNAFVLAAALGAVLLADCRCFMSFLQSIEIAGPPPTHGHSQTWWRLGAAVAPVLINLNADRKRSPEGVDCDPREGCMIGLHTRPRRGLRWSDSASALRFLNRSGFRCS